MFNDGYLISPYLQLASQSKKKKKKNPMRWNVAMALLHGATFSNWWDILVPIRQGLFPEGSNDLCSVLYGAFPCNAASRMDLWMVP